jgi:hypothetical protein
MGGLGIFEITALIIAAYFGLKLLGKVGSFISFILTYPIKLILRARAYGEMKLEDIITGDPIDPASGNSLWDDVEGQTTFSNEEDEEDEPDKTDIASEATKSMEDEE